jgi:hypothetical protein
MATRSIGGIPSGLMTVESDRKNGETESLNDPKPYKKFTSVRGEEYAAFVERNRKRSTRHECAN